MLCITPAAAVSADDFTFKIRYDDYYSYNECTYLNIADRNEKYIHIHAYGTIWLFSLVTFKPVNIPDAPEMVVDTYYYWDISLPQSVDKWEIRYYSRFGDLYEPDVKYLKNRGFINLIEFFGDRIPEGLDLELSTRQCILPHRHSGPKWDIPEVKWGFKNEI